MFMTQNKLWLHVAGNALQNKNIKVARSDDLHPLQHMTPTLINAPNSMCYASQKELRCLISTKYSHTWASLVQTRLDFFSRPPAVNRLLEAIQWKRRLKTSYTAYWIGESYHSDELRYIDNRSSSFLYSKKVSCLTDSAYESQPILEVL